MPSANDLEVLTQCPYCQSSEIKVLLKTKDFRANNPGNFYLSKCPKCQLLFQNPRIKPSKIKNYYQNSNLDYHKPNTNSFLLTTKINNTLINHFNYYHLGATNFWQKLTTGIFFKRHCQITLTPYYIRQGKVLEIGCSYGTRLNYLQNIGWQVYGIELAQQAAEYAQRHYHLNIQNKPLEEVDFEQWQEKFNVVILSMVLEHLPDPWEQLARISNLLVDDGQLIFSLPYPGWEYLLFKKYFYGLHLPFHYYLFRKKHLKKILKNCGFTNIYFYFQHSDRDFYGSLQYFCNEKNRLHWLNNLLKTKLFRYIIIKPILYLLSLCQQTSRVSVYATKN